MEECKNISNLFEVWWPYPIRHWVESMSNLVFGMCHSHSAHSWIAFESWIVSIFPSLRNHHLLKFIAASVARFGFGFSVAISIAPGSPLKYIFYFFEFCYNLLPIFFLHRPPCQMHWPLHQGRRHQYGRYGNCHTWGFKYVKNR